MSDSGVFEDAKAWDRHTKEDVDIEQYREAYQEVIETLNQNLFVLESNALYKLYEEGYTIDEIIENTEFKVEEE